MSEQTSSQKIKTWAFNGYIIRYQSKAFTIHSIFTILIFGLQVVPGLLVKAIFDTISGNEAATGLVVTGSFLGISGLWWLIIFYVLLSLLQLVLYFGAEWYGWTFRFVVGALLRHNLFASILRRRGDQPLPVSSGEAVNRFRIDVGEVSDFPLWLPDQLGKWIAALIAVIIMARIHLTITLVIFLPLVGVILITRLTWGKILQYHRLSARMTDTVTGFLGEVFGAVQAVKVADADEFVAARFRRLSENRAGAQIRFQLFHDLLDSLNSGVVTFGIGIVLLLAGQAITAGDFSLGDFALFVSYLWFTTQVPSEIGTFYGDYKTQEVSIDRMLELVRPESPLALIEEHPVFDDQPLQAPEKTPADQLERLEVRSLCYQYPALQNVEGLSENNTKINGHTNKPFAIQDINLSLQRGDFVVITGRVGSGKTTLLRVLLGVLPKQSGEIRWNGQNVERPSQFFRLPRCAYTSQVPRLFSDTLRNNILMGLPEAQVDLTSAIRLSVMEQDVAALDQGLDTFVGPRGIRLSGGQVQRAAAARMFVRAPELLVFDDLSSALDVETEHLLWERVDELRRDSSTEDGQAPGATCLVVSHRKAALRRADHIIVMKNGCVEAEGKLDELLSSSEEMQRLWKGEIDE